MALRGAALTEISTTAEAHERDAIPAAWAIHTDPGVTSPETQPLPRAVTRKPLKDKSPAEWAYERLILYIKNFEDQLDAEHEVAMGFAADSTGALRIEGIGYFDPDIVTFYGSDETGIRTQLIQHVSQLNVRLRALPRPSPQQEPRRIGFRLVADLEQD
ncbi:DUF6173 family protein [Anianabacter salinae]|uniref:DUF6173 family protein n=1 Tax=Anianabacter salinae TaxID=2851023 RepID=UPI00225E4278|nr:DUF6173 family protein [Anianabacter salinae]MBV0913257.1 hypothetical protein [Anianabacter salinae]